VLCKITINAVFQEEEDFGKDAKTVYVNDSSNLDTIAFDVKNIIEEIMDEEIQRI
jgi:hypothetical protein